jgi:ribosomal protein L37AE/L43A
MPRNPKSKIIFRIIDNCELLSPEIGMSENTLSPEELIDFLELTLSQLKENPDILPRSLIIRKRWVTIEEVNEDKPSCPSCGSHRFHHKRTEPTMDEDPIYHSNEVWYCEGCGEHTTYDLDGVIIA